MAKHHSNDVSRPIPLDFSHNVNRRERFFHILDLVFHALIVLVVAVATGLFFLWWGN